MISRNDSTFASRTRALLALGPGRPGATAPSHYHRSCWPPHHRPTFYNCAHYPPDSDLCAMEVLAKIVYFLAIVIAARIGVVSSFSGSFRWPLLAGRLIANSGSPGSRGASSPGSSRPEGVQAMSMACECGVVPADHSLYMLRSALRWRRDGAALLGARRLRKAGWGVGPFPTEPKSVEPGRARLPRVMPDFAEAGRMVANHTLKRNAGITPRSYRQKHQAD